MNSSFLRKIILEEIKKVLKEQMSGGYTSRDGDVGPKQTQSRDPYRAKKDFADYPDIPGSQPGQDSTENTRKRFLDYPDIPGAEPGQTQTSAGKMKDGQPRMDDSDPPQSDFTPIPGGRTVIRSKVGAIANLQRALNKLGAKLKIDGKAGENTYSAIQTIFPGAGNPKIIFSKLSTIEKFIKLVSKKTPEQYAERLKTRKDKAKADSLALDASEAQSASSSPSRQPVLNTRKIEQPAEAPVFDTDGDEAPRDPKADKQVQKAVNQLEHLLRRSIR